MPMTRPRTWAASSEKRRRRWYSTLHQPPDLARRFRAAFNRRGGLASRGNLVVRGSRLELVHALLEFANPFAHRAGNLRNPFGAEEEKDDDEDEEQFFDAESAEPHCASMPVGSRSDTLNLMVWAPAASRRRHGRFRRHQRVFAYKVGKNSVMPPNLPCRRRRGALAPRRTVCYLSRTHRTNTLWRRIAVNDASKAVWYCWDKMPKERVSDTLERRLVTGERMMLAHVYLKKGAVVPKHSHDNEQLTYILEGALKFWLG